jgi:hypothetical protein
MRILKAKNISSKINFPTQLFDVKDLRIIPSYEWLLKRMNIYEYKNSFEKVGMLHPIVVTDEKEQWVKNRILPKNSQHKDENDDLIKGLYVHVGNKRVFWAKENGYDKIEGYFITHEKDKTFIQNLTHINHESIPK